MTIVLAGQNGEAFQDVGDEYLRRDPDGTPERVVASRSAWSGSPCVIATRARAVSASDSNERVVVDTEIAPTEYTTPLAQIYAPWPRF